jgi:molybdopterin-guanine dinucleotide biosynthesis protein A
LLSSLKVEYQKITAFILDDRELLNDSDISSPLIGLYSTFKELSKFEDFSRVFIISCDMPLIKYEVLDLIQKSCNGYDCCIPRWKNGYLEPLFAIYPIDKGLKAAREMLKRRKYKLTGFFKQVWNINYISVEEEIQPIDKKLLTFINVNDMNDLNKIKKNFSDES